MLFHFSVDQANAAEQIKAQQKARHEGRELSEVEVIRAGQRLIDAQDKAGFISHPTNYLWNKAHGWN
jgi:hypothetical protein